MISIKLLRHTEHRTLNSTHCKILMYADKCVPDFDFSFMSVHHDLSILQSTFPCFAFMLKKFI